MIFKNYVKHVMAISCFLAESDVLMMLLIHLVSFRLCLHLDFHVKYTQTWSPRNKVWHICTGENPWTPFYGPIAKHIRNFSTFCQEQDGEAGPVMSSQISSLPCLAECYTGWHSCLAFNRLQFNIFLSLRTARYIQDVVQLPFMKVVNLIYSIYIICMFVENILIKPASFTYT